jgi:hypothetical protein
MKMDLSAINKAQGANKLGRQWNSVKTAANPPSRIVLQAQGVGHHNANMAVMDTDPEFAELWTLFKAIVDRKYLAAATDLAVAGVDSPDVHADVKVEAATAAEAKANEVA